MVNPGQVAWTITGASDWPMLMVLAGFIGVLFIIIQSLAVALMRSYQKAILTSIATNHLAVLERIATHRKEDSKHCHTCKTDHDSSKSDFRGAIIREFDALWKNYTACCTALGISPLTQRDCKGLERNAD